MKQLLTLVTCILLSAKVYADCAGSGLNLFPFGKTIKQNSIFILTAGSGSEDVIHGLNKNYKIYLKSGEKKIRLFVIEICIGQYFLSQAVLKPATEPEAGKQYTVFIDGPFGDINAKPASLNETIELRTYNVIAEKDADRPQLSSKPKETGKTLHFYGCGPDIHVDFSNPAQDQSEIVVRTTVKNLATRKETTFYLVPSGNRIEVGHNMCEGGFDYDGSNHYEVEFSFMDASGNFTWWKGERIKFTRPVKPTDNKE
jgi:hypothetical protein